MSVFRRILPHRQPDGSIKAVCSCGHASGDWRQCTCPRSRRFYQALKLEGRLRILALPKEVTKEAEAVKLHRAELRMIAAGGANKLAEFLNGNLAKNVFATIGAVEKAYLGTLEPGEQPRNGSMIRLVTDATGLRNVQSLFLVLAHALDLWVKNGEGAAPMVKGVKAGTRVPDVGRIRKLSTSVLTKDVVRKYQAACCEGVVDLNAIQDGNGGVNSRLNKARKVFTDEVILEKYEGLRLPDLKGFMKSKMLPQAPPKPDPIPADLFAKMVRLADLALGNGAPMDGDVVPSAELGFVNLFLRQTTMRVMAALHARGRDVVQEDGAWWLREGQHKAGTEPRRIPLTDRLAGLLRERAETHGKDAFLILPKGKATARFDLVQRDHSAWLKGIIGGAGEYTQGNHRLRDTAASVVRVLHGLDAAQELLAHASQSTTERHYGKLSYVVSPVLQAELAAWLAAVKRKGAP